MVPPEGTPEYRDLMVYIPGSTMVPLTVRTQTPPQTISSSDPTPLCSVVLTCHLSQRPLPSPLPPRPPPRPRRRRWPRAAAAPLPPPLPRPLPPPPPHPCKVRRLPFKLKSTRKVGTMSILSEMGTRDSIGLPLVYGQQCLMPLPSAAPRWVAEPCPCPIPRLNGHPTARPCHC